VAITRRRKTISLYINGHLVRQVKTPIEDHDTSHPLRVGSRLPNINNAFVGEIDGGLFFPRALSNFEVHELFRTKFRHTSKTQASSELSPWLRKLDAADIEEQLRHLGAKDVSLGAVGNGL
jgi:hypothetical protein